MWGMCLCVCVFIVYALLLLCPRQMQWSSLFTWQTQCWPLFLLRCACMCALLMKMLSIYLATTRIYPICCEPHNGGAFISQSQAHMLATTERMQCKEFPHSPIDCLSAVLSSAFHLMLRKSLSNLNAFCLSINSTVIASEQSYAGKLAVDGYVIVYSIYRNTFMAFKQTIHIIQFDRNIKSKIV